MHGKHTRTTAIQDGEGMHKVCTCLKAVCPWTKD